MVAGVLTGDAKKTEQVHEPGSSDSPDPRWMNIDPGPISLVTTKPAVCTVSGNWTVPRRDKIENYMD